MKTYTLEFQNDSIVDKVIWMLDHFKSDGLTIKDNIGNDIDSTMVKSSIKQAVNEINMVKQGELEAKPVEDLLNAI